VPINNAGINSISDRLTSADGYALTIAIGHLGHYVFTGLLFPLLNAAPAPRVVTVSSVVHGKGCFDWNDLQMEIRYDSQRAYNQTKLANLLFAREFQRRTDQAGGKTKSIAVHPGVAKTSIRANRKNLGRYRPGDYLVSAALSIVMPFLGQPASAGALPTMHAAVSPDAKGGGYYGPDGFGEMKGAPKAALIKPVPQDMVAARRLWGLTEQINGLRYTI